MTLRRGDSGAEVKALQRGLNKLGSILLVDGDFGAGTADAVRDACGPLGCSVSADADERLQTALRGVKDPFPPLSAAGVTFIARLEVSGPREYRQKFAKPVWPSVESGITIGIGYDLQFVTEDEVRADWSALPPSFLAALAAGVGVPGSVDRLARVNGVTIPLLEAMRVFLGRTLPKFVAQTRSIYPQIDDLSRAQRTALVSLVYNRGTRLKDRDPAKQERREMRKIRTLLAAGRLDEVDEEFESMTRLWDPARLAGLVKRRRDEARLWRSGFGAVQLA
jgi:peptidoglycan hydrolase-like protein with peptidoglycan-binding domain